MIKKRIPSILLIMSLVYGCKPTETITLPEQTIEIKNPFKTPSKRPLYRASKTKTFDLIHTKLAVKFDWEKAHLYGVATLTLKPHFYETNQLILNARGFDLHKVEQITSEGRKSLNYKYNQQKITINLDKEYTRKDTLIVFIDYTSKPNELKQGGSDAISSDKGLYFINPTGKEKNKAQQIWTQGETESNSAWFPTIDSPNQKSTQEIAITVKEKYKTLSNGILTYSEINGDGTRTDFWEMNLPHAPYLFMMAVGEFDIIKDKWRDIDIDYYVEHEYAPYAKDIFGLTPEMMEFYSDLLGVNYPWQKYSQVVVRDYVSGAMENTTAVIHGDFVYQTKREMIDGSSGEDVIAHELFHHWFGDLVTCESWSNLPLNESFATYGEFLWREYKYGADKAAEGLQNDLNIYLQQAKQGYKDVVRFDYGNREEMFDGHSYQKGSRILHMLRNYIGDDAFFASLKLYLETNKYTDVEMHQLRIACEKITGEDLNWFFDQWFFAGGHPILEISYEYNDSTKTQIVNVKQTQDLDEAPLYYLPVKIDIYTDHKKETKEVVIDKVNNSFVFKVDKQPDLVNFDGDKMLLCEKIDNHNSIKEWQNLFYKGSLYLDRHEAIQQLKKSKEKIAINTILDALYDIYPTIRQNALRNLRNAIEITPEKVKTKLLDLAKNDKDSHVRGIAIQTLSDFFDKDPEIITAFEFGITEESYYVIGTSLNALSKHDLEKAMNHAKKLEVNKNSTIINSISKLYAENGTSEHLIYFIESMPNVKGFKRYDFTMSYAKYLKKQEYETVINGIGTLKEIAINENVWWMRMVGINSIIDLENKYKNLNDTAEEELKTTPIGSDKEFQLKNTIQKHQSIIDKLKNIVEEIKEKEKDPRLKAMLELKN